MSVPPDVVAALPGTPVGARQLPLAGSWRSGDITRVTASPFDVVVKRWQPVARIRLGVAETTVLTALAVAEFPHVARIVPIGGQTIWLEGDGRTGWTAQRYVEGRAPGYQTVTSPGFAEAIGEVLARFHLCATAALSCPSRPGASRLAELDQLPARLTGLPDADAAVVKHAYELAASWRDRVMTYPRCQVHGDVNAENLLCSPSALVMIDLEFTRFDVRLLDLAALAAPLRRADGTLRLLPADFLNAVASGYSRIVSGTSLALPDTELRLLPVASLMHFLLVVGDQLRVGSRNVTRVLPIIGELARRAVLQPDSLWGSKIRSPVLTWASTQLARIRR